MTAEHRSQKKPSGTKQVLAPRLVIDPDLDTALRKLIQQAEPSVLRQVESAEEHSPWQALLAPLSTRVGRGLLLYSGCLLLFPEARAYADLMLKALFEDVGAPAALLDWTIAPGLLAAWSLSKVLHRYQQRAEIRRLRAARAHYVITDGLGERARALIGRADHALHTARRAVECEDGAVGRAQVDELGREPWEISVSLRDLVEFTASSAHEERHSPRLDGRRGRQDAVGSPSATDGSAPMPCPNQELEEVWKAIEHRVGALVSTCEEVVALNAEFGELRKPVESTPEDDALLDLRASTARHALAQTDLEALRANLAAARRVVADGTSGPLKPSHELRAGLDGD
ncbi:hypothetical protein [Streptomyces tropicalis]|uniref:Uncharacterized protein n=1 Tax=Streptomyces tropicalis TaxID=3034234 RepID=A0ABT6AF88_9ACTN|nr:hypothetical protein [Streptomyces tropicalis]MDF3303309.1 hypothetical protein [Streptomyces tropicalis]